MIVWRAVQGFIGGGMVPTVFASAYLIFPGPRQKMVAPIVGLIATLAPTIGPTIGGYLTETYGWQTIFFINTAPSLVMVVALWLTLEREPMRLGLLKEGIYQLNTVV